MPQAHRAASGPEPSGHGTAAHSWSGLEIANPALHRHVNDPGGSLTHSVFGFGQGSTGLSSRHSLMSAGKGFRVGNEQHVTAHDKRLYS
jgi:hypothetical protein